LEDAAAIRNLKARYAALCDAQYDADGIAMLFTEDALWESPDLGRFEGREAISTACPPDPSLRNHRNLSGERFRQSAGEVSLRAIVRCAAHNC
jgi:hypothetical protein